MEIGIDFLSFVQGKTDIEPQGAEIGEVAQAYADRLEPFCVERGDFRKSHRPEIGERDDPEDPSWAVWEAHFSGQGIDVPVGRPGISPLGIYLSDFVLRIR